MKKIHFVSGARSEFDILSPVIRRCADFGLDARVVLCAAQLSPFHGLGIEQIRAQGYRVEGAIESLLASESDSGRALSFANVIEGLVRFLSQNRPDMICVAGDREEALAAALAGNFLGIHVAHLFGGDRCIASDIDEVFRPAISKLAHFHFTATEGHRERLIRMGEHPENIWTVGGTGLDGLAGLGNMTDEELNSHFGADITQPFFLVIHHPTPTFGVEGTEREMLSVLQGVLGTGARVFCSYPNFDPGNMGMRRAIDAMAEANPSQLVRYHNLPREVFAALYRRAAGIVGNSSSIIIEAGFLKKPGILCGPRQDLRERGGNVIRVDSDDVPAITAACRRALGDADFLESVARSGSLYGDGHAGERVARILGTVPLTGEILRKTNAY
ncbi:MAG: UDP-N-acetylglucosamine 2-epimerase (hydrolyzing) [Nitrosomonadales bacterium]|nr:UDP-N-acetylglucosamine 2-epimerase (hydrolyzing) [Nitrosomonadales bacterium]